MAKRIKIGLIYSYNKDWVAGAYYILNLVHALNLQDDIDKPELVIFSFSPEEFQTVKDTDYPYLKFHQLYGKDYTILERALNKLFRVLTGKNIITRKPAEKHLKMNLDMLFPATNHTYFSRIKNRVFWIPDFQEYFLPQFFSEEEITSRQEEKKNLADSSSPIVFSSNNALEHFKMFYPHSNSKTFVLQFAVTHPVYNTLPIDSLRAKYNIDKPYFFCPNQVWAHKNHSIILETLSILRSQGHQKILVVFSGKETDHRNPGFFSELKNKITEKGIEDSVRFLGFIDRAEQLQLMKHSIAVIQPSLFEGWSTSIEDAKAMSQYVIASDLPVHREQLSEAVSFFDPLNATSLAEQIVDLCNKPPIKIKSNYNNKVKLFGKTFVEIAHSMIKGQ